MKSAIPQITVIMPVRNVAPFVNYAVESILNQTFSDFEFIIIDDCSTDNTAQIIKGYLNDKRIIFIQNTKRLGLSASLNMGIQLSQSNYIARMDGDDISDSTRFEKQINYLNKNKEIILLGTSGEVIDFEGNVTKKIKRATSDWEIRAKMMEYNNFIHGSVMIRREALLKTNLYSEEYVRGEDYALWLEMLKIGKVGNLPDSLYKWRKYPEERKDNELEMNQQIETHNKVLRKILESKEYKYEKFLYKITQLISKLKGK